MSVLKIKQGNEWINLLGDSAIEAKPTPLVAADWNQNDPSAYDYIKNRTHYDYGTEVRLEVLPECVCPLYNGEDIPEKFAGKVYMATVPTEVLGSSSFKYTVTINGISYENIPYGSFGPVSYFGDYIGLEMAMLLGGTFPEDCPFMITNGLLGDSDSPDYTTMLMTSIPPKNGAYTVSIETTQKLINKEILPETTITVKMVNPEEEDSTLLNSFPGAVGVIKSFKIMDGMEYEVMYDDVVYHLKGKAVSMMNIASTGYALPSELMLMLTLLGGGDSDFNMYCLGDEALLTVIMQGGDALPSVNPFDLLPLKYPFTILSIPMLKIGIVFDMSQVFPNQIKLEKILDDTSSEVILPLRTRMGYNIPYMGYVWNIHASQELEPGAQYRLTTRDYVYVAECMSKYDSDLDVTMVGVYFEDAGHAFIQAGANTIAHIDNTYSVTSSYSAAHKIKITGFAEGIKKLDSKYVSGGSSLMDLLLMGGMMPNSSGYSLRGRNTENQGFLRQYLSEEQIKDSRLLSLISYANKLQ